MPIYILQALKMNDKLIIGDYRYKISSLKVDLTDRSANLELFTDLDLPIDSIDNEIPLTVDSTDITVDNDNITIDTESLYNPVTSYTTNGISLTNYTATKGEENFEVKILAKSDWNKIGRAHV